MTESRNTNQSVQITFDNSRLELGNLPVQLSKITYDNFRLELGNLPAQLSKITYGSIFNLEAKMDDLTEMLKTGNFNVESLNYYQSLVDNLTTTDGISEFLVRLHECRERVNTSTN